MQENKFTVTNIIIALTVVMYFVQTNINYGTSYMGLNDFFIEYGFWWQPLSSMFAHGGLFHLGMNMLVLYQFGSLLERYAGTKRLLILYFVGGIATSLLSFAFMYSIGFNHNLVGASGAICVLLGYVALMDRTQRKGIITWVLLISVAPVLIGLPVAWYAHFIGLGLGFVIGKVIR
jgi:membrane associated rhomboid family serine protease